jgi:hypothetical protein
MKKANALKALNVIIGILMLNQLVTGLIHEHLAEETFEFLHIGSGLLLVTGTIIHLIMNRTWIKAVYFSKKRGTKA